MITESQIKAAVRRVTAGETPRVDLKDDGERGAGRLALIVRRMNDKVATGWYAVYYRDGKRALSKVGSYPLISLPEARKKFREEYAPAISSGAEPASVAQRRRHRKQQGTVRELFEAYVQNLRSSGKRCADDVERMLLLSDTGAAAHAIGAGRAAASIDPRDIVAHLAEIHERGSPAMAVQVRAYLSASFGFGMRSEHDYTRKDAGTQWGIKSNPVSAIPADKDAFRARDRFLSPAELRTFWLWLESYSELSRLASALRLMLATGQRAEEILRITTSVYERPKSLLYWEKTKNGLAHSIPLPAQAVAILDELHPNVYGIYFANQLDAKQACYYGGLRYVIHRFREAHPEVPPFVPKDARRTWKTLAGDAGLSKEIRDRLQNHSKKSDISSRHYDRYDYLAERRAAMAKWAAYLELVIAGDIKEIGQRESNVVPIGKGAAA
jgi:integrase